MFAVPLRVGESGVDTVDADSEDKVTPADVAAAPFKVADKAAEATFAGGASLSDALSMPVKITENTALSNERSTWSSAGFTSDGVEARSMVDCNC